MKQRSWRQAMCRGEQPQAKDKRLNCGSHGRKLFCRRQRRLPANRKCLVIHEDRDRDCFKYKSSTHQEGLCGLQETQISTVHVDPPMVAKFGSLGMPFGTFKRGRESTVGHVDVFLRGQGHDDLKSRCGDVLNGAGTKPTWREFEGRVRHFRARTHFSPSIETNVILVNLKISRVSETRRELIATR